MGISGFETLVYVILKIIEIKILSLFINLRYIQLTARNSDVILLACFVLLKILAQGDLYEKPGILERKLNIC